MKLFANRPPVRVLRAWHTDGQPGTLGTHLGTHLGTPLAVLRRLDRAVLRVDALSHGVRVRAAAELEDLVKLLNLGSTGEDGGEVQELGDYAPGAPRVQRGAVVRHRAE